MLGGFIPNEFPSPASRPPPGHPRVPRFRIERLRRQDHKAEKEPATDGSSCGLFSPMYRRYFVCGHTGSTCDLAARSAPYALILFSRTTWPQMLTCLAKNVEKSLPSASR